MKQSFLMPYWCKIAGVVLSALFVVEYVILLLVESQSDPDVWSGFVSGIPRILHGLDVIVLSASLLMIAFSREKDEDEYVAAIRGKYLILAFYIDSIFLIVATLSISVHNIMLFYKIMVFQMFMVLFLHIVMFNIAMAVIRHRNRKEARNEE